MKVYPALPLSHSPLPSPLPLSPTPHNLLPSPSLSPPSPSSHPLFPFPSTPDSSVPEVPRNIRDGSGHRHIFPGTRPSLKRTRLCLRLRLQTCVQDMDQQKYTKIKQLRKKSPPCRWYAQIMISQSHGSKKRSEISPGDGFGRRVLTISLRK